MPRPIYLDYMSTTPLDPRVAEKIRSCLDSYVYFGNSSSDHYYGWEASEAIEKARAQVAALINADPREIIWTSGATEAINLAIKGAALFYQRKGKHIITLASEHKAVLDSCDFLASQGFEVTYLNPESNGLLDINKLESAIRSDTVLLSIMHVNNETGIIQDLVSVGKIAKEKGLLLHVDAAQSFGKIPIDIQSLNIDLMSMSAHKMYGPKGIGALYVRRQPRIRLQPLIHGGGQELGLRSGTLATHQIVGMGEAAQIAKHCIVQEQERIKDLRDKLWNGISILENVSLNGDLKYQIFGCLNVSFDGINNETLQLSLRDLAISSGSACNAASLEPSHVLLSMGLSRRQANQSVRISIGRFTTEMEIDHAISHIIEQVHRLRKLSPR